MVGTAVASKKEKPEMRCYQADQSQFLHSASAQCTVIFSGGARQATVQGPWLRYKFAIGSTQKRKLDDHA